MRIVQEPFREDEDRLAPASAGQASRQPVYGAQDGLDASRQGIVELHGPGQHQLPVLRRALPPAQDTIDDATQRVGHAGRRHRVRWPGPSCRRRRPRRSQPNAFRHATRLGWRFIDRDPTGFPVAHPFGPQLPRLPAPDTAEDGQEVRTSSVYPIAPPRIAAGGRQRDLIAQIRLVIQPTRDGPLCVLHRERLGSEIVDKEGKRSSTALRAPRVRRNALVVHADFSTDLLGRRSQLLGLEADDPPGLSILEKREILRLEAPHRSTLLVEDDDVDRDRFRARGERGDGLGFLCGRRRRHQRGDDEDRQDPHAILGDNGRAIRTVQSPRARRRH